MGKDLQLKGRIDRITRIDGKDEAQMTVVIPMSISAEVPLGKVNITIQSVQPSLDLPAPHGGPRRVRGNKG